MDHVFSALIGALTASIITPFVTHFLLLRRSRESRRTQDRLRHTRRQIDELYGPLLGLIEYDGNIFGVAKRLISETIASLPGGSDLAHAIRLGIKPFAELGANSEA